MKYQSQKLAYFDLQCLFILSNFNYIRLVLITTNHQMGQKLCPPDTSKIQQENRNVIPINSSSVYNTKLGYLVSTQITSSRNQVNESEHGLILKVDKQGKLFTKYFLIYNFYISKYNSKQGQYESIYTLYMNNTFLPSIPEVNRTQFDQLLADLERQNSKGKQRNQLKKSLVLVDNVFKSDLVLKSINQICLNTTNPIEIVHVIFPLAELYNGISKIYHDRKKKYYSEINVIYVIVELQQEEVKELKEMKGKICCFSFSVFVKGFTKKKTANDRYKELVKNGQNAGKKTCLFEIALPKNTEKMQTKFDEGFYLNKQAKNNEQNVLINIKNSFNVIANPSQYYFQVEYGHISSIHYKKYIERAANIDPSAIQIFQICNAISNHYLKSQSWLMRILKQSQNSTSLSKTIISNSSIDNMKPNQAFLQSEIQVVNLINDYIDKGQYDDALKMANKYSHIYTVRAKRIQILFKTQKYQQVSRLLDQIGKETNKQISQGEQIVQFIRAKMFCRQGKKKMAMLKLENLRDKMKTKYGDDFQIIGRDLLKFIEQVDGKKQSEASHQILYSHSQVINQLRDINLRGISTSI